ncbi:MAG: hypothetical protein JWO95_38 [Verrucomicrobiales bacterium]|nr:hypothetical protein [Verrucomicrobiales bacterium]
MHREIFSGKTRHFVGNKTNVSSSYDCMRTSSFAQTTIRALALATVLGSTSLQAATIWSGSNTNFTQNVSGPSDHLTARVIITRGQNFPIYNSVLEGSANKTDSPKDTEWAFGTLANHSTLTYKPFYTFATASSPGFVAGGILGKDAVCHLKTDDIYLQVHFTAWGSGSSGGFAYTRSTPAAVAPTPTVNITNPPSSVYSAPANVKITAIASVSSGTVTNVSFFRGTTLIGSSTVSPYSITASNLGVGVYNLTAVATAAGISATSPVVTVTIINPVPTILSIPVISNGIVSFNYTADPGILYTVQSTTDFTNWNSGTTNSAAVNPTVFSEPKASNMRFYRVARMPNP